MRSGHGFNAPPRIPPSKSPAPDGHGVPFKCGVKAPTRRVRCIKDHVGIFAPSRRRASFGHSLSDVPKVGVRHPCTLVPMHYRRNVGALDKVLGLHPSATNPMDSRGALLDIAQSFFLPKGAPYVTAGAVNSQHLSFRKCLELAAGIEPYRLFNDFLR